MWIQKTCLSSTTNTTDLAALPNNASGGSSLQSPVSLCLYETIVFVCRQKKQKEEEETKKQEEDDGTKIK